ncbi:Multicopper oxidase [Ceratobasidium sp. AG-Ba]|nr:Multicopper oxidase [Ceratobasidium sp. AG-Ba]
MIRLIRRPQQASELIQSVSGPSWAKNCQIRAQTTETAVFSSGRYDSKNPASPDTLYTLKVQQGKRYRLRLINASATASYMFSVAGHKLQVIEADGVLTQPLVVDQLEILASQRYSVILYADRKPDTYWINAPLTNVANMSTQALLVYENKPWRTPVDAFRTWTISDAVAGYWKHQHGHHHQRHRLRSLSAPRRASGLGSGLEQRNAQDIRSISGSAHEKRVDTASMGGVVLDESKLVVSDNPYHFGLLCEDPKSFVEVNLDFALNFDTGDWMINNSTYKSPAVPTLLQILTGYTNFSTSENTYKLEKNKCIQTTIGGQALNIDHPFHLHGHAFDVVQIGNQTMNLKNPPRRDVAGVNMEPVKIRFMTDNPGPWFLHCHIDWHLAEGLAIVFAEAPSDIPNVIHPDSAWKDLCRRYDALSPEMQ